MTTKNKKQTALECTPGAITSLLAQLPTNPQAGADLMPIIYASLHRIAGAAFRNEQRFKTRQTTDLLNETYIRLMEGRKKPWASRAEFFSVAAKTTRHVLTDWARKRDAGKRDGKLERVDLTDGLKISRDDPVSVLFFDDLLKKLSQVSPRLAEIVEMRFFAGLSIDETAEALGISHTTVKVDWLRAKRWLGQELGE